MLLHSNKPVHATSSPLFEEESESAGSTTRKNILVGKVWQFSIILKTVKVSRIFIRFTKKYPDNCFTQALFP